MGRKNKRLKREDSSSESSPSNSTSSILNNPTENKQLDEISSTLSLILKAITDLTDVMKGTRENITTANADTAVAGLPNIMKYIEDEIGRKTASCVNTNTPAEKMEDDCLNFIKNGAMLIKSSIATLWEKKLKARKNAYWGYVRNSGNLGFHEKWISANPGLVLPRKIQKFEIINENEAQRALRERAILHEFRTEIEMEKLKTEACIERYRKIDQEMTELISSKCSGPKADFLLEQWRINVQRNEDISHKRWANNEKWLKSYEEDFLKTYEQSNPFFKKGKPNENFNKTYSEAVSSTLPPMPKQNYRNANGKNFIPNGFPNRQNLPKGQQLRGSPANGLNSRHLQNRSTPFGATPEQNNSGFDALSLLDQLLRQNQIGNSHNGRRRRHFNNRSNNSDWLDDEDDMPDTPNSFLAMDRNWKNRI
ncbi:MAG: hypothetical protein N0C90_00595 [Candidatus Thiodiazotropha endolucinida]|nr:hypothetical protein [Candidatus Thiodiazotropha taylori]MCW4259844.1 hypothetical protein [Candidatus Thiodiazotropha endolucinida]